MTMDFHTFSNPFSYGWVCPQCKAGHAPWISRCYNCTGIERDPSYFVKSYSSTAPKMQHYLFVWVCSDAWNNIDDIKVTTESYVNDQDALAEKNSTSSRLLDPNSDNHYYVAKIVNMDTGEIIYSA